MLIQCSSEEGGKEMGFWNKIFKKKKQEPEAINPVIIKEEKIEVKVEDKKVAEKPVNPLKETPDKAQVDKKPAAKKNTKKP